MTLARAASAMAEDVVGGQQSLRPLRAVTAVLGGVFVVVVSLDTWYAALHDEGGIPLGRAAVVVSALALLLGVAWAVRRARPTAASWLVRLYDTPAGVGEPQPRVRLERVSLGAGLLAVLVAFVVLETSQPYYFTQDDNMSQFLPVVQQACSSVVNGDVPSYDPHQLLGMPTTALGVYSLTYPPTCGSYAVAKLLGDGDLTLEVFALFHLLAGYLATWLLARMVGVRGLLAAAVAAGYALSGYVLVAGRSWYYMLPVALWVPLLLVSLHWFASRRSTWRWVVGTAAVVGLFFHAGNAQMWSYAMLFYAAGAAAIVLTRRTSLVELLRMAGALGLGLAIAAPLLLAQAGVTADIMREGGVGRGFFRGLASLLLPVPLVRSAHPENWGNLHKETMGQFYFSGGLLIAVGALALAGLVVRLALLRGGRPLAGLKTWLLLAGLALALGSGNGGRLWPLLATLPGFSEFNFPFKFLPFATLFLLLAGGIVCTRASAAAPRARRVLEVAGVLVLGVLVYHAAMTKASFSTWGFEPYPAVDPVVADLLAREGSQARVLAVAPLRSTRGDFFQSLQLNFATVTGQPSLLGYDPLVIATPENQLALDRLARHGPEALRQYGVGWMIEYKHLPIGGPGVTIFDAVPALEQGLFASARPGAVLAVETDAVRLWRLPRPRPLAFSDGSSGQADLIARSSTHGVLVDVGGLSKGAKVTVNVLARPGMSYHLDGRSLPGRPDDYGRVTVVLPRDGSVLRVHYVGDFGKGLVAGGGLAALSGGLLAIAARREHRRRIATADSQFAEASKVD